MSDGPPYARQNGPYTCEERASGKAWCSCGLSRTDPYCDGAHRNTSMRPVTLRVASPRTITWCGCKRTKTPPYCDGSHATGTPLPPPPPDAVPPPPPPPGSGRAGKLLRRVAKPFIKRLRGER